MRTVYTIIQLLELPLLCFFTALCFYGIFKKSTVNLTVVLTVVKIILASVFCISNIAYVFMRIHVGESYVMQIILAVLWAGCIVMYAIVLKKLKDERKQYQKKIT